MPLENQDCTGEIVNCFLLFVFNALLLHAIFGMFMVKFCKKIKTLPTI